MAENLVTAWGSTTDFSAAILEADTISRGLLVDKDIWNANSPTDFYGTNGAAKETETSVSLSSAGALTVNTVSNFKIGGYVWVTGTTLNSQGYYRIDSITTTVNLNTTAIDGTGTITATENVNYSYGGIRAAFDDATELQDALDDIGTDVGAVTGNAINNLDILCYKSIACTIAATIDVDGNVMGSTVSKVKIINCNSSFDRDTASPLIITTTSTLASGLLSFTGGASYIDFYSFDFDGGGVGKAEYCIANETDAEGIISFKNCLMHNADNHGVIWGGSSYTDRCSFWWCEVYNNGLGGVGSGIIGRTGGRGVFFIVGCGIHDNEDDGIIFAYPSSIIGNRVYNNGGNGIECSSNAGDGSSVYGNTVYACGGDGFVMISGNSGSYFADNSASSCVGLGYNCVGIPSTQYMFSNNHSHGNSQHTDTITTDAEWADFNQGGNITGDPLFTSVVDGSEDFHPLTGSPLLAAGVGGSDKGAYGLADGGGGGVNLLKGLLS